MNDHIITNCGGKIRYTISSVPKKWVPRYFHATMEMPKNIKFGETLDFMFEENIPGDVTKENRKPINVIWVEQRLQTTTCMCEL